MSPALSDRAAAVYALLRLVDSWIPPPAGSRPAATAGWAPAQTRYVSCPDCLANGRTMYACETCAGRGELAQPGPDPYAEAPASVPDDARRAGAGYGGTEREAERDRRRAADRELERLQDAAAVRAGAEAPLSGPLRAIEARDRLWAAGSFAELARALETLDTAAPRAARRLRALAANPPAGPAPVTPALAEALEHLAELLPDRIRVPRGEPLRAAEELATLSRQGHAALWHGRAEWHAATRARRAALVLELVDAGVSTATIAHRLAITRRRVQQIVAGAR